LRVTSFTHNLIRRQKTVVPLESNQIKRINTRDARQICTMLDTTTDRTLYASSMATTLKGIANIEVDITKVLAAKDSGLDAWSVLLSMLSAYGINHDNVLEVK
jgi:hypothetical protein